MHDLYINRYKYDAMNLLADLNDTFFKNFTVFNFIDNTYLLISGHLSDAPTHACNFVLRDQQ